MLAVSVAQAQETPTQVKQNPVPIPTGVVPLPSGTPKTTQQSPVPPSAKPLPSGEHPLLWSPKLEDLNGFVAKQPITMDQAVSIGLYTSKAFAVSVANLVQVAARAGETRTQLFPTLGLDENLTYFDKATTVNFGAFSGGSSSSGSTSSSPPLVVLPQFNPVFTAALSLPVDLFGTLQSAASQARFNEVAARLDVNRVRNQVVYDVKNAFYVVLRSSAQVAVAEDTLNTALVRLSYANKNYAAGVVARVDVISAQRDVADAQQAIITANAQVAVNLAMLKNTMGLDVTGRLSIKNDGAVEYPDGVAPLIIPNPEPAGSETPRVAPPVDGVEIKPETGRNSPALDPGKSNVVSDDFEFGPNYSSLLSEAYKNRPEILEAEAQVSAGKRGLQYARRSSLPSFRFAVEDIYTANSTPLERKNQEALVFDISVPIFDGGLAREAVKEQHGVIAQAEINRRNAQGQVQVDVQSAYIALEQARKRTAVANVEVAQARESLRVSLVRYRAGVAQTGVSPQLELRSAQETLAQAENNLVNAIYDYNSARAQLDRATGRYGFIGSGPGYKATSQIPH
jgi:outer membrane protein TolC